MILVDASLCNNLQIYYFKFSTVDLMASAIEREPTVEKSKSISKSRFPLAFGWLEFEAGFRFDAPEKYHFQFDEKILKFYPENLFMRIISKSIFYLLFSKSTCIIGAFLDLFLWLWLLFDGFLLTSRFLFFTLLITFFFRTVRIGFIFILWFFIFWFFFLKLEFFFFFF